MKQEETEAKKAYNFMAEEYHRSRTKKYPKGWFFNELLEMPTTLKLLGNVKGKKILDFGCGTGIYAKLLTKKGATVKGFDISPEMIKIAKKENPNLDLRVASGYDIPFREKFDIVIACLVLGYFKNWNKVFKQVSKVLKKDGEFIFSTGNPIEECFEKVKIKDKKERIMGDYFKERKFNPLWKLEKAEIKVPFYHITYETIINIILKNNFEIIGYKDAFPIPKSKRLFPEYYKEYTKYPIFTVWKVKKK